MGEGKLQQADELNVRGYYERLDFQRITKTIAGSGYDVRWGKAQPTHLAAYRRLIEVCSKAPIWGIKNPRMAYTFNYIHPLLKEAGVDTRVVWAHREFESVVASFHHHTQVAYGGRWPMSEAQARAHMEKWRDAVEWQLEQWDGPVHCVDYDQLLNEPVTELLNLHDYCYDGLEIEGHKRVITPALNWLEKGLRHHVNHRPDAGPDDGDADEEPGFGAQWIRKRPCCGGGRREPERVDEEHQQAPTG
jgi:hypothetical protein